jgi:hypothetical protein
VALEDPPGSGFGRTVEIKSVLASPAVWAMLDQLRESASRGVKLSCRHLLFGWQLATRNFVRSIDPLCSDLGLLKLKGDPVGVLFLQCLSDLRRRVACQNP